MPDIIVPRLKYGRNLRPTPHPLTLDFKAFLKADAEPPPPEKAYWEYNPDPSTIGMYGNDTVGDCVCAYCAHLVMRITAHTGKMVVPELGDVIEMYSALTGYDPSQTQPDGSNPTDTGTTFEDAYAYLKSTGLAGVKIYGWSKIDHTNYQTRAQGVYLFLGVGIGIQCPASAQDQFSAGQPFSVVDGSPIEGGHAIDESGYGGAGENYGTWGKGDQKAERAWSEQYSDEGYIVLTPALIKAASDVSPTALNYDALTKELQALSS
jgi:hypothetical protein